jgi:hypothetical protein
MTKIHSILKYSEDFASSFDARSVPDVAYVESMIAAIGSPLRLKGAIDGSSGSIAAPTSGALGDTYYVVNAVSNGSTFFGQGLRNGDAIIVVAAYVGSPPASNFIVLEKNDDLATTSVAGLVQLATQAIANLGANNEMAITPATLAGFLVSNLYTKRQSVTNPLLNSVSGICNWQIGNTTGSADVIVQVMEASSNNVVWTDININAVNITISFASASSIAAGTYKAVLIG